MSILFRLFEPDPVVDVNAKCPACGHRDGLIKLTKVAKEGKEEPMIEHTCRICGAHFYEPTVLRTEKWLAK